MSALGNSKTVLASAVTNTSTFTMPYPSGLTQADLLGTTGGRLAVNDNDTYPQAPSGAGTVAFSFGASNITVTNNTGVTLPANATVLASFGREDVNGRYNVDVSVTPAPPTLTAATGTTGTTINDVTGTFSQSVLNNNFKALADAYNALAAAVKKAGITAG